MVGKGGRAEQVAEEVKGDVSSSLLGYLQISKPRIILLLDFVAVSALIVAGWPSFSLNLVLPLLAAGSLASAGSAAINSYLDIDIDRVMSRTMKRPIPLGRISPSRALLFGVLTIGLSLLISITFLNLLTTAMIMLGALFYIFVYTILLKRRTTWNIVIGGFAGSAAAFAGWSASRGTIEAPAILMGVLVFLWTPSHFWSLAVLSNDDYIRAGVPMLPAVVGKEKAAKYIVTNTLLLIPFSLLFFFMGFQGLVYLFIASISGILLLITNINLLRYQTQAASWTAFKYSSPYLAFIFLGMIVDKLLPI